MECEYQFRNDRWNCTDNRSPQVLQSTLERGELKETVSGDWYKAKKSIESTDEIIGAFSTLSFFAVVGFLHWSLVRFKQVCRPLAPFMMYWQFFIQYSTYTTDVFTVKIVEKVKACCQMIARNICLCLTDTPLVTKLWKLVPIPLASTF